MKIIQCIQGSDEWHEHRKGKICSSQMHKIITPVKAEYSKSASKYAIELCSERMRLGPPVGGEAYASHPMQRGHDVEADARSTYEYDSGLAVQEIGGLESDCGRLWASTDGLVIEDAEAVGVLELKAPMAATHTAYALDPDSLVMDYRCQIHGELIVSGLKFVDVYSYGVGAKGVLKRVYPDEFTDKLRAAIEKFWGEYMQTLQRLRDQGYQID